LSEKEFQRDNRLQGSSVPQGIARAVGDPCKTAGGALSPRLSPIFQMTMTMGLTARRGTSDGHGSGGINGGTRGPLLTSTSMTSLSHCHSLQKTRTSLSTTSRRRQHQAKSRRKGRGQRVIIFTGSFPPELGLVKTSEELAKLINEAVNTEDGRLRTCLFCYARNDGFCKHYNQNVHRTI
jgi:hypothetical protein